MQSDEGCNEEEYELSLEDVQKYTAQLEHNKKVRFLTSRACLGKNLVYTGV